MFLVAEPAAWFSIQDFSSPVDCILRATSVKVKVQSKSSAPDRIIMKRHWLHSWISTSSDLGMRNTTKQRFPVLWVSDLHRYTAFSGVPFTYFTPLPQSGHVTQMPLGRLQMLAPVSTKAWVVHITTPVSDRRSMHALISRAFLTEAPRMK